LVIAASIVVLSLVLVAPVDGQSVSSEHRFQLVHPIFPHVHWDGDLHSHEDEQTDVTMPEAGPDLMVYPAGAVGSWPIAVAEGMLLPVVQSLLGLWLAIGLARRHAMLVHQVLLPVPTGPPR